MAVTKTCD